MSAKAPARIGLAHPGPQAAFANRLGNVLAREVLVALHLRQATHGAFELLGEPLAPIQLAGCGLGGDDEIDVMILQLVHQGDEAARFILVIGIEHRYVGHND